EHVFGPAVRVTVPIFNQNQGNIAKAEAELEKAIRFQTTLGNQINMEVRQAFTRYEKAKQELQLVESKILPEVDAAIARAAKAYREGNASLLLVLETNRQMLDSRLSQAQLRADVERSWAELERNVGRHIAGFCPACLLAPQPQ